MTHEVKFINGSSIVAAPGERLSSLEGAKPADLLEEALKALAEICEMQRRRYGDGMRTHMDLIGLCDDARAILTKSQGEKIDG